MTGERETTNAHTESLDSKAGGVLGFAGVLVGLGATAQATVTQRVLFQIGISLAVAAALIAAWAFLPRKYPVLQLAPIREATLMDPESKSRPALLDTQIDMVRQAADLVQKKGRRIRSAVGCLAVATALVVAGTLQAAGGHPNG